MHLTKSIDYAIIMEGEIEMLLDDGSTTLLGQGQFPQIQLVLKITGDVVVQRGTNHQWKVQEGKSVKILFCIVDGGILPSIEQH